MSDRDRLRTAAEARLAAASPAVVEDDHKRVLHELQVHRIELEMQNEELRRAQVAIEESRDRYRDLYELAPVGYLGLDGQGLVIEANLTACTLLGVERKHLLRQRFDRFLAASAQDRWWHLRHGELCAPGDRASVTLALRPGPSGKQGFVRLDCQAQVGAGGTLGLRIALTDITAQQQAEAALRSREMLLRTITENSPDAIFFLDRAHRIEYLNPAALEFVRRHLGRPDLSLETLAGHPTAEVFGDDALMRAIRTEDERAMASNQASSVEDIVGEGEDARHHLILRSPIRQGNDVVGLIGVARDITARKREEAARLADLERQRDTLVREVHHRIKNHLQGVLGLLRMQIDERPELAQPLGEVMAQVSAIAGVYGLHIATGGLGVELDRVVALVASGAVGPVPVVHQSQLGSGSGSGPSLRLADAHAVPVALAINELIGNALKHLTAPDPRRPVRVSLETHGASARIAVRNGPAVLPLGFDLARRRGLGTGLELVTTLLSGQGTELCIAQDGDAVCAELWLRGPVIASI